MHHHVKRHLGCATLPVAMALAWEVCGLGQRAIGEAFGVIPFSGNGVSH